MLLIRSLLDSSRLQSKYSGQNSQQKNPLTLSKGSSHRKNSNLMRRQQHNFSHPPTAHLHDRRAPACERERCQRAILKNWEGCWGTDLLCSFHLQAILHIWLIRLKSVCLLDLRILPCVVTYGVGWANGRGKTREKLMQTLQRLCSPQMMLGKRNRCWSQDSLVPKLGGEKEGVTVYKLRNGHDSRWLGWDLWASSSSPPFAWL